MLWADGDLPCLPQVSMCAKGRHEVGACVRERQQARGGVRGNAVWCRQKVRKREGVCMACCAQRRGRQCSVQSARVRGGVWKRAAGVCMPGEGVVGWGGGGGGGGVGRVGAGVGGKGRQEAHVRREEGVHVF